MAWSLNPGSFTVHGICQGLMNQRRDRSPTVFAMVHRACAGDLFVGRVFSRSLVGDRSPQNRRLRPAFISLCSSADREGKAPLWGRAPDRARQNPRLYSMAEFQWLSGGLGGDGGIRTLDRALQPYNGLANRRLQPLGHVSCTADMPDAALSRKRQIASFFSLRRRCGRGCTRPPDSRGLRPKKAAVPRHLGSTRDASEEGRIGPLASAPCRKRLNIQSPQLKIGLFCRLAD
jgi:hypothetical protein